MGGPEPPPFLGSVTARRPDPPRRGRSGRGVADRADDQGHDRDCREDAEDRPQAAARARAAAAVKAVRVRAVGVPVRVNSADQTESPGFHSPDSRRRPPPRGVTALSQRTRARGGWHPRRAGDAWPPGRSRPRARPRGPGPTSRLAPGPAPGPPRAPRASGTAGRSRRTFDRPYECFRCGAMAETVVGVSGGRGCRGYDRWHECPKRSTPS